MSAASTRRSTGTGGASLIARSLILAAPTVNGHAMRAREMFRTDAAFSASALAWLPVRAASGFVRAVTANPRAGLRRVCDMITGVADRRYELLQPEAHEHPCQLPARDAEQRRGLPPVAPRQRQRVHQVPPDRILESHETACLHGV